ncbi:redoxin domain-containing protein [Actinoplanes sp. NBC_00393]|uniref:redoxin domain-containing protein n=1 Tax=Actinoplanes sp. NBC_00393 TaxID=2975953 RepID=UPI002E20EAB2
MSEHLPAFSGATGWLNSGPLGLADLGGRVVLVNFWTFTCINWLRQEPYVRAWSQAYSDDGLVVIGVHTPEFGFEHDLDRVRLATKEREIDYPVVVDNDYAIWRAFDNHYWPALYFADRHGVLRDFHFGEGRYEQSERALQQLLGIEREPVTVDGSGIEAAADWDHLRTPETYLGGAKADPRAYQFPSYLGFNQWALDGGWTITGDCALGTAGARIAFRYQARDAHLVLASPKGEPIPFRVLVDGEAPGPSHGVDVDADGHGVLTDSRLYQLVREHDRVRERTLQITFRAAGAEAYAFTFG